MTAQRLTVPRTALARIPARAAPRPAHLQSDFLAPTAGLKGLCSSFAGMILGNISKACTSLRRPFFIEANNKRCIGDTLRGTRRRRTRVSGYRTRAQTPSGRKVLKARRAKGRKALCPANNYRK
ncbi:hypothetical protein WJX72_009797 [[Myrmecia] bisecta]|uniref:Ribosomal protein L34 n=1 Tax=[Myrmecia] bisecta TaxID=41462 RepID=A0AAW1PTT1_9CHLO